ncbi:hypothetical protein TGGT1_213820 [Toxoplasma gondii GT1]|uniref:Uncharacterized protein n=5 Tax=Toxoplasma gondii TaxID=5811 RepID=S7UNJ0_TOXGG|nr:hypothetical protein TGGT1_213820 [Toxoplasma gondii GT1]KAF4643749.1 hypothetical protein TGRH88_025040 [Toxoplasma gondii]KFG54888.1 hypothetical protein TGFOU_213820 [Toxoplasma gondii FOU]PUA86192.1 hypothetical protein TGBR9_213820 [Toxoplasma gondii TgCATBr9]RQX69673.1 hypothetical protein TGCAST_213820 [Toxoplasma gondii CAST]
MAPRRLPPAVPQRVKAPLTRDKESGLPSVCRENKKAMKERKTPFELRVSEAAPQRLRRGREREEERKKSRDGWQSRSPPKSTEDEKRLWTFELEIGPDDTAAECELQAGESERRHSASKNAESSASLADEQEAERKTQPERLATSMGMKTSEKRPDVGFVSQPKPIMISLGPPPLLPIPTPPSSRCFSSHSLLTTPLSRDFVLHAPVTPVASRQRSRRAGNVSTEFPFFGERAKQVPTEEELRSTGIPFPESPNRRKPLLSRCLSSFALLPSAPFAANSTLMPSTPRISTPPSRSSKSSFAGAFSGVVSRLPASASSSASLASRVSGPSPGKSPPLSAAVFLETGGWDPLSDEESDQQHSNDSGEDDRKVARRRNEERKEDAVPPSEEHEKSALQISRDEESGWTSHTWGDPWSDNEEARKPLQKNSCGKKGGGAFQSAKPQKLPLNREAKKGTPLSGKPSGSPQNKHVPAVPAFLQRGSGTASCLQKKRFSLTACSSSTSTSSSSSFSLSGASFSSSSVCLPSPAPVSEACAPLAGEECRPDANASWQSEQVQAFPVSSSAPSFSRLASGVLFSGTAVPSPPPRRDHKAKDSIFLLRSFSGKPPPPPPVCAGKVNSVRLAVSAGSSSSFVEDPSVCSGVSAVVPPPPDDGVEKAFSESFPRSVSHSGPARVRKPPPTLFCREAHLFFPIPHEEPPTGKAHSSATYHPVRGSLQPPDAASFSAVEDASLSGFPPVSGSYTHGLPPIVLYGTDSYFSCSPSVYEAAESELDVRSFRFAERSSHALRPGFPLEKPRHGRNVLQGSFSSSTLPPPAAQPGEETEHLESASSHAAFSASRASKESSLKNKRMQLFVVPCLSWRGGRYFSSHRCVSSARSFDAFPVA